MIEDKLTKEALAQGNGRTVRMSRMGMGWTTEGNRRESLEAIAREIAAKDRPAHNLEDIRKGQNCTR